MNAVSKSKLNNKIQLILKTLSFLAIYSYFLSSSVIFAKSLNDTNHIVYKKILISQINISKFLPDVSQDKLLAAATLATTFTDNYRIIKSEFADSINKIFIQDKSKNLDSIVGSFGIDYYLYCSLNRFENMVRIDLVLKSLNKNDSIRKGVGYANRKFKMIDGDASISDPAILKAFQSAFAAAVGDTNLYMNLPEAILRVKPAPTLSIGSMEFKDKDFRKQWNLFEDKLANSYDACEVMFEEANKSSDYVAYDIQTRDTMYTKFKFYLIENYNALTNYELDILQKFDISYCLTGQIERFEDNAVITLNLLQLKEGKVFVVGSASETVTHDTLTKYRDALRTACRKLFKLE